MADRLTIEQRRAQLGEQAVFSAAVAAELVPGATRDNLLAFDEAGIVYLWRGRRMVVWGDVLRLIRGHASAIESVALPTPPQGRGGLVRARDLPKPARLR